MEVDDVIERIGGFGAAQKKIVCLVNFAHIAVAFHALSYTFIAEDPGWLCAQSGDQLSKNACAMVTDGSCAPKYTSDFTSIVTEWNLVCGKSNLPKLSQSAYFLGLLIGAWIFGRLSDIIGRRKTFFISCFILSAAGLGYGFAFNYYFFVAMRMLCAIGGSGFILASYVLSVELVGRESRNFAGLLGSFLFACGYGLVALSAYLVRDWRFLTLLFSVLGFGVFFLWNIVPESPRWLAVQGRMEEARAVLSLIAEGNGTVMPSGEMKKPDTSSDESLGVASLFSAPVIRRRTLTLFAIWFTNCVLYYALAMRSVDLGDNRYTRFALSGLVELPAVLLAYKLLNRLGRRWTHGGFLVFAGLFCIAWSVVYWTDHHSLGLLVALLGKFSVAGSFSVIYLYSAELFPTQVRNVALGVVTIGARLGGIMAPIVLMMDKLDHGIPILLVGSLAFLTGLFSLGLPETLDKPLPDTLQALEMTS